MTRLFFFFLALASCSRPVDLVATANDASADAPIDAGAPETPQAGPIPRPTCPPGTTILVLAESNALYAFDPPSNTLTDFGVVTCPELGGGKVRAVAVGDDQLAYLFVDDGQLLVVPPGPTNVCKVWDKGPAPPTGDVGFAILGTARPLFYIGLDSTLFRAPASPLPEWQAVGKLASDTIRALVGTGDARLYAVLPPATKTAYRVARLDPDRATAGATVLVPTSVLAPDPAGPAGFALWGDTLLVFTEKEVARYVFSTGDLSAPTLIPLNGPVVAAASPPCASTLD